MLPFFATVLTTTAQLSPSSAALPAPVYFSRPAFDFRAGYNEAVMEFDLPITSHTGKTLKVLSVQTSCTCMKVSVPEPQLEPGMLGRVHCVFTVPNALGTVQKPVILKTDSRERPNEIIMVRVEVPGILHAEPPRLIWKAGDLAEEKTLRITVVGGNRQRLTKVNCSRDIFEWTLKSIEDGREYELHVKPKATGMPTRGMFLIQTDSSVPRQKLHSFYAVIEPRTPTP